MDGVIRVQAPCLTKSCAAVKLYEETTACDIIDKFRSSNLTNNGKYVLLQTVTLDKLFIISKAKFSLLSLR